MLATSIRNSSIESVKRVPAIVVPASMVAAFLFCLFAILTFLLPPRAAKLGYFAALSDKHHLLEVAHSPKIIFIGGSNLAFGLDSSLIEAKFHRPVVNMGLCAPFGLRYLLEEVKDNITPGDTIVLVPEYYILQDMAGKRINFTKTSIEVTNGPEGFVDGSPDLIRAVEVYPRSVLFILRAHLSSPHAAFKLLQTLHRCFIAKWAAVYSMVMAMLHGLPDPYNQWEVSAQIGTAARYCFNKNGDYFGHFNRPNVVNSAHWELFGPMNREAEGLLNCFGKWASSRGVDVVLIPPPVPPDYFIPSKSSDGSISAWTHGQLDVPVLADPRRYVLPTKNFFEPPYHLNISGRNLRTNMIAADLDHYFSGRSSKGN
ncbi:MAG: hypothetical protein C5B53_11725 [Candidatus Melainabacteria bacterium]|nr:MAG: hypothetical protein C5B53_11725 [Candidatus Melainabacteria bacterium]